MTEKQRISRVVRETREKYQQYPNRLEAKLSFASALIEQGRFEKFRHYDYKEAERIFREVLTLDSYHPAAHYHLGFLAVDGHRWEDAIDHLECALVSNRLDPSQKEKAQGYLAAAYFGKNDVTEAEKQLKSLNGAMNEGVELALFVKRMQQNQLLAANEYMLYSKITRTGMQQLHLDEYDNEDQQADATYRCKSNELILNLAGDVPVLRTSLGREVLPNKRTAQFLDLLITTDGPVTISVMKREVFGEEIDDGHIRVFVNRLRARIANLFAKPPEQILTNIRSSSSRESAYEFCWDGPFYVYRKNF
jgi:hypothetical protein